MKAIVFGIILLAAAVAAVIPAGLGWWPDVLLFLRGGLPVVAVMIGLLAVFIGIADIKDREEAKKEEEEAAAAEAAAEKAAAEAEAAAGAARPD